jgi:hypothetical protein
MKQDRIDYDTFMNLARQLVEEQYSDDNSLSKDYDYQDVLDDYEDNYVAPEKKPINKEFCVDMTNVKSGDIGLKLQLAGHVRAGKFLVKIRNQRFVGEKCSEYLIEILEENNKLHKPVNIKSDKRFIDAPTHSGSFGGTDVISEEIMIDLIYWLKMIDKMPIFF